MTNSNPFQNAIQRLNTKNSKILWMLTAFLSAFERFDGTIMGHNMLFPILNLDKIGMLTKAIVQSKAMDYKDGIVEGHELGEILNLMIDTKDFDSKRDMEELDKKEFFTKFFILTANSQVRFQHTDFRERMARAYALLQYFPEKYEKELRKKVGASFLDIPKVLEEKHGIQPKYFFQFAWVVFVHYARLISETFIIPDEIRRKEETVRKDEGKRASVCFEILKGLVQNLYRQKVSNLLFLTPGLEDDAHPVFSKKHFAGFLSIAGRTKQQLQQEFWKNRVYRIGRASHQLCTLERFPVVHQADGSFIVPNLRFYETAIPLLLHYELQDMFPGNEYNDITGAFQEYYLLELLKSRIPNLPLIPETTYKRGRNEVKGPDFTLIDLNDRPILIESKSKRFQARTRILADHDSLEADLKRILAAFEKLPTKHDELFAETPEYREYASVLRKSNKDDAIHVVVISGGIEMLSEIIAEYIRVHTDTPLSDYQHKYCIIDIADFEYAVEVAATGSKHLSDLLTDYWTSASLLFAGEKPIQGLHSYKYDKSKSFITSIVERLFASDATS